MQIALKDKPLSPVDLFTKSYGEYWLEIGFGTGEHVAALMRTYPNRAFIAAEPFINGMGAFLYEIRDDPHDNVRIWQDDGIVLVDGLADACLDGIYILNPDPWPKKRHYKRRIINRENLDRFARILKPGGQLILTTDVDDLANWMTIQTINHAAFIWQVESVADWRIPPNDWIATKYESKGIAAGRKQVYLQFKRMA